jgi:hypothetical protein
VIEPNGSSEVRRPLTVDAEVLEAAFTSQDSFVYRYLDLETGEVEQVSEEVALAADMLLVDLPEGVRLTPEMVEMLAGQAEIGPGQEHEFQVAVAVETAPVGRFAPIARRAADASVEDMEEFASTVDDSALRDVLLDALDGVDPASAFDSALLEVPGERERWLEFRDERLRAFITAWLNEHGVEPVFD